MLALAVNAQHTFRAAAFRFEGIKSRITADIENRLSTKIRRKKSLDRLPWTMGMIDRLTHHALGLGVNAAAKIDAVKPRFESF